MLESLFVGDGELLAAFFTAGSQYTTAISRRHTLTESVLILSFSA